MCMHVHACACMCMHVHMDDMNQSVGFEQVALELVGQGTATPAWEVVTF